MRHHTKASTEGSTQRQTAGLGPILGAASFRGILSGTPAGRWVLALLALAALFVAFAVTLSAQASVVPHPFLDSFGADGTSASEFSKPAGLAVDQQSQDIYVADVADGAIYKFDQNHQPADFSALGTNEITGIAFSGGAGESQIAVDSTTGVIYATDGYHSLTAFKADGLPYEFSALGSNEISAFNELLGVAVDANGDIYAGDYAGGVHVYGPSGSEITSISSTNQAGNLAVDSSGNLYINYWHSGVEKLSPSVFPVTGASTYSSAGMVDPHEAFSVAVEPSTDDLYVDEGDRIAQYRENGDAVGPLFGNSGSGSIASSQGLGIDGASGDVYVSDTADSRQVKVFGPLPEPIPVIERQWVSSVSPIDATLNGVINPDGLETTYSFEYGTDTTYGHTAPIGNAGKGEAGVHIGRPILGLLPGTLYHYRVVANNSAGVAEGQDDTFITPFSAGSGSLPDDRAYEMVSPPDKNGLNILNNRGVEAAEDGGAATFSSLGAFADAESAGLNNWYRAERAQGAWTTRAISPPDQPHGGPGNSSELLMLSPAHLSRMLMRDNPAPPVAPGTQLRPKDFYRKAIPDGIFENLTPIVPRPKEFESGREFGGADSGLDVVGINSFQKLTPDAPDNELFKAFAWVEGSLHLVGVLPDGTPAPRSAIGYSICCRENRNAISGDGSQIVFSASPPDGIGRTSLYLRERPGLPQEPANKCTDLSHACTIEIAASRLAVPHLGGEANYQGASVDGSQIFFSDTNALLEADPDSGNGSSDLYLYEPSTNSLRLISIDLNAADGVHADFVKALAVSESGKYVYFTARGMLVPGQPKGKGQYLYLWHDDGSSNGSLSYIAALSVDDVGVGVFVQGTAETTQVDPSGRFFLFSSRRSLTGYENENVDRCLATGKEEEDPDRCRELYLYDDHTAKTVCISCDPSGEIATGSAALYGLEGSAVQGIGDILSGTGFISRNVLADGRVFFETEDDLVPQDSNRKTDVYEWEPQGVGSCDALRVTASGGCIYLLSTGTSPEPSHFGNATPGGSDVFFLTSDRLVGIDRDSNADLYDVRVNGGLLAQNPPPGLECEAEGCRGSGAARPDPAPVGTAALSGLGNLRHGRHKHRHRRHQRHQHKHRRGHHRRHQDPVKQGQPRAHRYDSQKGGVR